ncbi:class I SAM-dependent methyltransferase [Labilibacter sediminis]|nr:class I SAM-dependent methyltransferase [Labilibacter sediminis]
MNELDFLVDLNLNADRQGPGGVKETLRALSLIDLDVTQNIKIADIGCGSGAQAVDLALNTNAQITAVDIFPQFLDKLEQKANDLQLSERITVQCESMDKLSFDKNSLDVIWSEGAVYIMGFRNGVQYWHNYLKPGGYIAVSEITWTSKERPAEIENYWQNAYPEIATASEKIKVLEEIGYKPVGFFTLPEHCWMDNYYLPLQKEMAAFLEKYQGNDIAKKVVEDNIDEIELYKKYKEYYTYGFYVAKKI